MYILTVTPSLAPYDAVSNDALLSTQHLKKKGHQAFIFSQHVTDNLKKEITNKTAVDLIIQEPENILIYHHSIFWKMGMDILQNARCRIFIRYHNITPSEFFQEFDKDIAEELKKGQRQTLEITQLRKKIKYLCASSFNAKDILSYGVDPKDVVVIAPLHISEIIKQCPEEESWKKRFRPENLNIVFTGRLMPHKGLEHLLHTVDTYASLFDENIRLFLVGRIYQNKKFIEKISKLIEELKIAPFIEFAGCLSDKELATCLKNADVFLLMSEHEGFCIPILEAQHHDLPILALARGAIKETIGHGQLLLEEADYAQFAIALSRIKQNKTLREFLIKNGNDNALLYSEDKIKNQYISALELSKGDA